jgi:uncharacterized DUF497 family protein
MALTFEWDTNKAKRNVSKHGTSFEESTTVFADRRSLILPIRFTRRLNSALSSLELHIGESCWLLFTPTEATISASLVRERRADENENLMKKAREKNGEMLLEYDFAKGVRGKYARR